MKRQLGGRFGYLFFGKGRGSPRRQEKGGNRFFENPRKECSRMGRGQGAGRVSAANWGIFFGGGG